MSWLCPAMARASLAAVAVTVGACSGEDDASTLGAGETAGGTVSCNDDPRLDAYMTRLDKPGELGVLSFRFSDLEPARPAKGSNTFHVQVTDASGQSLRGGLGVDPKMPDHGHGTSVKPTVTFDLASDTYTVTRLYLFMPGVWQIEFDAYSGEAAAARALDRVALHFCIEG